MGRDGWSRRDLLAATAATAACGCTGQASATPEERPGRTLRAARTRAATGGAGGELGTMFRPAKADPLPKVPWAETPPWFRDAGGLWCPAPRTGGASLLLFTERGKWSLPNRIKNFRELPELHAHGKLLGTDIVYLIDYYEGLPGADPEEYCWNKGEYVPRADLGGPEAFKAGIKAVHEAGGKVILYLEPFVINQASALGKDVGKAWSIRTKDGYPDDPYPDAWKLCPAERAVVDHLVGVAGRLVGEYGADGLHLDSYGFQRDWKCVESAHGHSATGDPEVFNEGAKALVKALKAEITRHDKNAVLMCEGPRVAGLFASVSASQEWGANALVERWIWNAAGKVPVFTSGWNLDDLHQILALGHRLTLGAEYWHERPPAATLGAYLDKELPRPIPDKKDKRFRRFFGEDFFRVAHQFRNAGLLLGRPMPNIDHAAPRRWDREDAFNSHEGLVAILDELTGFAKTIDDALAGAELPAPTEHVRKLVEARTKLGPVLVDSSVTVVDTGDPATAAYRFEGPNGRAFTAVNVGSAAASISVPKGRYTDLVSGEAATEADASVPGHAVRLWVPA